MRESSHPADRPARRRTLLVVAAAAAVLVGGVVLFLAVSSRSALADPDCPADAPAMAFNVSGALRQDDVAVTDGEGSIDRLTHDHASWDPSFSPDGSTIVFVTGRHGYHMECCGFDRSDVYVMDSDGARQRPLMELPPGWTSKVKVVGSTPEWSPDGAWIALVQGNPSLTIIPAGGGEARPLHELSRGSIGSIAWSPDSRRIAFSLETLREEGIFVVDVDAKEVEPFATDLNGVDSMDWSPDGDTIAFESFLGRKQGIFTVSASDPEPKLLVEHGQAPAWSPDGSAIAYLSDGRGAYDRQIFTLDLASGDVSLVDTGTADLYSFETDLDWLSCPAPGGR